MAGNNLDLGIIQCPLLFAHQNGKLGRFYPDLDSYTENSERS
jgi:hypothetical protein